jgi:hypothetical protein
MVDGKNIRMVQSRGCLRFLLKAPQPVRIARNKRGQDLDGDFAPQRRIAGAIDLTHPSCAQEANNVISIQFRAWG